MCRFSDFLGLSPATVMLPLALLMSSGSLSVASELPQSTLDEIREQTRQLTEEEMKCIREWRSPPSRPSIAAVAPPEIGRQPYLESIATWGGGVVAFGETAYRVDLESGTLTPVDLPGCPSVLALEENSTEQFALCSHDGDLFVMSRARASRADWSLTLDVEEEAPSTLESYDFSRDPKLAISEDGAVVVGVKKLWWKSGAGADWRKVDLDMATWDPLQRTVQIAPEVAHLSSDSLFLGWSYYPKDGHSFYRFGFDPVDGPANQPERIAVSRVRSVVEGGDGTVWVGAGYGEVPYIGQVLAVRGESIRTILDESDARCARSDGRSPAMPRPVAIQGVALDPEGRPLVLAEQLGIYRLEDEALVPVIEERLYVRYVKHHPDLGSDVVSTQGSAAVGIVATERGIFVASRSLGVFVFLKDGDEYRFSQIVAR